MECMTAGEERTHKPPTVDGLRLPVAVDDDATVRRVRALIQGVCTLLDVEEEATRDAEYCAAELLGNAVKHAEPPVELCLRLLGAEFLVAVIDAGAGMPIWPGADAARPFGAPIGELPAPTLDGVENGPPGAVTPDPTGGVQPAESVPHDTEDEDETGDDVDVDALISGLATGGRGLELVTALTSGRCGSVAIATRHGDPGKAVWFTQPVPGPVPRASVS